MSTSSSLSARPWSKRVVTFLVATMLATLVGVGRPQAAAPVVAADPLSAGAVTFVKTFTGPPVNCVYNGGFSSINFVRGDCVRFDFVIPGSDSGSHTSSVQVRSADGSTLLQTIAGVQKGGAGTDWYAVTPIDSTATPWQPGKLIARVMVDGSFGSDTPFYFNELGATVNPGPLAAGDRYEPGDDIPLEGSIYELNDIAASPNETGVPATFKIRLVGPDGSQLWLSDPQTAQSDGTFPVDLKIPGSATSGVTADITTDYKQTLAIEVVDAAYTDSGLSLDPPRTLGDFAGNPAGTGAVTVQIVPPNLVLQNQFSSVSGWVKPGDTFPFRVFVRNYTSNAKTGVTVTIPHPDSVTFVSANPLVGSGSAGVGGGNTVTWNIGTIAAATSAGPTVATLVVNAKAATLAQDPEVVWKDLSNTATLTYSGGPGNITSSTHGPKVIPPLDEFDTARYGDKPFVMVPVDFTDRTHDAAHTGDALSRKVNSAGVEGSTFNLYQEMSFGQLFPNGVVPSAGIASAGFDYAPGFNFTQRDPTKGTCRGTTIGDVPQPIQSSLYGTPAYPERIHDGWYQLPGDTEYYGGDWPAFTLGTGSTIDGACGPTSKSVYDAAQIADPEIDYDDYDLDKDGVVDFFMMVFTGLGGNGDSQLNGVPPYDNIWPHSSSLEYSYTDSATGLKGYISDDQMRSLEDVPQCWTSASYTTFDDCAANGGTGDNSKPVYERVGPYNVNPESAIDHASVISHEYGHHLGLPDFYSTSYTTYNDWFLMASDYSQHYTVFGKQEYGWVVPTYVQPGQTLNVDNWSEIKNDTGKITWQRPDGSFYTLSAANGDQNIHNGQVYAVKLPRRQLISETQVQSEASLPSVMYSDRGNDFGCTPIGGHNLDIALPELAAIPDGTTVTLSYKSKWDMEWDFDYGFTMVTTNGTDYTALPSANNYTTPSALNPNSSACQQQYGNGLTGTSGSYRDKTFAVDRNPASPTYKDSPFLADSYDLSDYAGKSGVVLRFSYYTDPGFDRPGWFIDDLKITAGSNTLYATNFTDPDPLHIFQGGCGENGVKTADHCTDGWSQINATSTSDLDHAYYLELRDRSGFDFNGHGQSDRGSIDWSPGVLIEYTDEARGYGNNAASPPRQHYIDSQPEPGLDCGEALTDDPLTARDDTAKRCDDAAFTAAVGDSHYDDNPNGGADPGDWIDNFSDPASDDGFWHFAYNCLSLDVTSMSGADADQALPSNLTADAIITALPGCAAFSYTGGYANAAPVAAAQAKPTTQAVGKAVIFDGSGSSDDLTPTSQLIYQWDWDNNGTYDQTGQTLAHTFSTTGVKTVKLKVTDKSTPAKFSTDTVQVTITPGTPPPTFKPDLQVLSQSYTPTTVHRGNGVTFKATVKNFGDATANTSYTAWYRKTSSGKKLLGKVSTPSIPVGQTRQIGITFDTSGLKPGTYTIYIKADWTKVITEKNEKNNILKFTFVLKK
jgi:M6 family metalloprotease-like protein